MTMGTPITDLLAHFDSKLIIGHDDGHWSLKVKRNNRGYCLITIGGGKTGLGHRVAYELLVAPIPDGYEIDHRCRVRWCVNPDHLDVVTRGENVRRASILALGRCRAGLHDILTLDDVYVDGGTGWKACRECVRIRQRARRSKTTATPN